MTKFGIFVHCRLIWCPVGRLAGGCGARAVSRKTPTYFMIKSQSEALLDEGCHETAALAGSLTCFHFGIEQKGGGGGC